MVDQRRWLHKYPDQTSSSKRHVRLLSIIPSSCPIQSLASSLPPSLPPPFLCASICFSFFLFIQSLYLCEDWLVHCMRQRLPDAWWQVIHDGLCLSAAYRKDPDWLKFFVDLKTNKWESTGYWTAKTKPIRPSGINHGFNENKSWKIKVESQQS